MVDVSLLPAGECDLAPAGGWIRDFREDFASLAAILARLGSAESEGEDAS